MWAPANFVHFSFKICHLVPATLSVYNMQLRNIGGAKCIVCPTNPTVVRATVPELGMDWIHPWIGWIGLDWVR